MAPFQLDHVGSLIVQSVQCLQQLSRHPALPFIELPCEFLDLEDRVQLHRLHLRRVEDIIEYSCEAAPILEFLLVSVPLKLLPLLALNPASVIGSYISYLLELLSFLFLYLQSLCFGRLLPSEEQVIQALLNGVVLVIKEEGIEVNQFSEEMILLASEVRHRRLGFF